MNRYIQSMPLGAALALALAAGNATAQTTAPATAGTASAPATVGVTPQEAAEATRKAVPRSDTGTVVRTSPSPAERASGALNNAGSPAATTPATGTTGAAGTGTAGTAGDGAGTRPARADRN